MCSVCVVLLVGKINNKVSREANGSTNVWVCMRIGLSWFHFIYLYSLWTWSVICIWFMHILVINGPWCISNICMSLMLFVDDALFSLIFETPFCNLYEFKFIMFIWSFYFWLYSSEKSFKSTCLFESIFPLKVSIWRMVLQGLGEDDFT